MTRGRRSRYTCGLPTMLLLVPVLLASLCSDASAQGATNPRAWTLQVHSGQTVSLSVDATDAPLMELAADLAKQLKIPVTVQPSLRQALVKARFEKRSLEDALKLLAPRGY